jgi:N-acetylmuramoyl-L-alanine amidase
MRFWVVFLLLWATVAGAFPRWGLHDGYTRLVFDLPLGVTFTLNQDRQTLSLQFSAALAASTEQKVDSPQLSSYQIVRGEGRTTVTLRLKTGITFKQSLLAEPSGQRLIVDLVAGTPPPSASTPAPVPPPVAPPVSTPAKPAPQPVATIVIDAGHGGIDPGAVGYVTEKVVTLDVALQLKKLLEGRGLKVILTRDIDKHLSPDKSTDLGKRAEMATSKQNLFISIHVNSTEGLPGRAQGVETYYFGELQDASLLAQVIRENGGGTIGQSLTQKAKQIASSSVSDLVAQANQRFSRELAQAVQKSLVKTTAAVDRGVHAGPWYVIRNARIPAILVEIGFANHPTEGKKLGEPAYRATIAQAIFQGVVTFLGLASR